MKDKNVKTIIDSKQTNKQTKASYKCCHAIFYKNRSLRTSHIEWKFLQMTIELLVFFFRNIALK